MSEEADVLDEIDDYGVIEGLRRMLDNEEVGRLLL